MSAIEPQKAPRWLVPALGVPAGEVQRVLGARALDRQMRTERAERAERGAAQAGRRVRPAKAPRRESAVLILLRGDSFADAQVLLTHRSPSMRSHSGQIAFPGGRREPEDASLVDAALREAWEETGLDRAGVTPLDQWGRLRIWATGNVVSPVLAYWHEPGRVYPASPRETDDVFLYPLAELANPRNRAVVSRGAWRGPAFFANGYVIWGFTAGVLASLLRHAGWEEKWDNNSALDLRDTLERSRNNEKMG